MQSSIFSSSGSLGSNVSNEKPLIKTWIILPQNTDVIIVFSFISTLDLSKSLGENQLYIL